MVKSELKKDQFYYGLNIYRKNRTRTMSTQAFVNSVDNPGYDEQPVGTQSEPVEEETENDYENIGKFTAQMKWISNIM